MRSKAGAIVLSGHVLHEIRRRWDRVSPRAILLTTLGLFWVYCWPGFVGWDTYAHLLAARSGVYTDGHPPAVSRLVRISELFIAGPAGMLLIQSLTFLLGLYYLFKTRLVPRNAAVAAALVFLFPLVSGVQALIAKDCLMAGFLMLGIACLCDERRSRQGLAVAFIAAASLMRWNALAATFTPMLLLYRWRPSIRGVRRYAFAVAVWASITGVTYELNELMTTEREYFWYSSTAYQDIGCTLEYMPPQDDATMEKLLEGVPLRIHHHIWERFHAIYYPAHFFHLIRGEERPFDLATTPAERDAITRAWKRIVVGNPRAYLRYRWDNWRLLLGLERKPPPPGASAVYVWFSVIAAPETIPQLEHDASASRIQAKLRAWSIWISLTPVYWNFLYLGLSFVLLPLCRKNALEMSLLLSAIGYELAWFFLAQTTDIRYSQWMVICSLTTTILFVTRQFQQRRAATPPE